MNGQSGASVRSVLKAGLWGCLWMLVMLPVRAEAFEKVMSVAEQLSRRPEPASVLLKSKEEESFVRVYADKATVYPGETIQLTYELLTRNDSKAKAFETMPQMPDFFAESYSSEFFQTSVRQSVFFWDKQYTRDVVSKIYLYAETPGMKEIQLGSVRIVSPRGGNQYQEIVLTTDRTLKIMVKALPEARKPLDFNGLVGDFKIKSWLDESDFNAQGVIHYYYELTGNGNLHAMTFPLTDFPEGLKVANVEDTMKYAFTDRGYQVTKTFNVTLKPDEKIGGGFWIPQITVSYFSPSILKYRILSTQAALFNPADKPAEAHASDEHAESPSDNGTKELKSLKAPSETEPKV